MADRLPSLAELSASLESGKTSSRDLVEAALEAIGDPDGEGARAFVHVDTDGARARADEIDSQRRDGRAPGPLAGIPISVKDLFDLEGQVTRAGSKVLNDRPAADRDAACMARLRSAGLVFVGRTNMTEFAYSGIGLNPHYPAPRSPYDRTGQGRVPGGSSSGAAVSVADGMVVAGIGTDTGGSCRIPATFCGIVGYKPTARRIDTAGAFPLSQTLDSIGPFARSVDCCASLDAVMAGEPLPRLAARDLATLKLGVLRNYVLDGLDDTVSQAYKAALDRLQAGGVRLVDIELPDLADLPGHNVRGGIIAAEAYATHKDLLAERFDDYDPRINGRMLKALEQHEGEYQTLLDARRDIIARANARTVGIDALIMPTVPVVPPRVDSLSEDAEFYRVNALVLRNPSVVNFLDRCAISLPLPAEEDAPVGLMLVGETMADRALFDLAAAVEASISSGVRSGA